MRAALRIALATLLVLVPAAQTFAVDIFCTRFNIHLSGKIPKGVYQASYLGWVEAQKKRVFLPAGMQVSLGKDSSCARILRT